MLGVLFIFAFINIASYRSDRVEAWKHPETAGDKGYQTMQALYAIGSGKLFGKGLGQSLQKLGNVPEAENDMIFSIICEELGLFGAVCVILLFVLMLWRMMVIANNAKDLYRGTSGDGHYVTYCDSGSFKYCGCYQYDSEYRCHSAVYQLRRYLACIPYGRDGACAERVEGASVWIRSSRFVMIKEERRKKKKKKYPAGNTRNPDSACAGSPDYFTVFKVKNVEVEGNKLYDAKVIEKAVLNDEYSWNSLYVFLKYKFVNTSEVPFVDTMEISLKDPQTLHIKVYEKGIMGYLYLSSINKNVYFDKDGIVTELSDRVIEDTPQILGIDCKK